MTEQTIAMTPELYEYVLSVSLREPDVLRQLREETAPRPDSSLQISPEQGQFMALLVRMFAARKTLEIGVFTGYSSLVVAMALPEDGRLIACDIDEHSASIAKRYWQAAGVAHKIDLRLAPALETLDQLTAQGDAGSFDFIFIDADKEQYDTYYERSLQLLRTGGLVAIDNTLWYGSVADPEDNTPDTKAIRELNLKLLHDERVHLSLVPIADGLTLALKK